jgi:hypothetical protein
MTYPDYKAEVERLLREASGYEPFQAGYHAIMSKLADLAEAYPEFDKMIESE